VYNGSVNPACTVRDEIVSALGLQTLCCYWHQSLHPSLLSGNEHDRKWNVHSVQNAFKSRSNTFLVIWLKVTNYSPLTWNYA